MIISFQEFYPILIEQSENLSYTLFLKLSSQNKMRLIKFIFVKIEN